MIELRRDDGQVLPFTVLFLGALIGMAALVLDAGAWFRADRRLQAAVDAAALAGAQALPEDPGEAVRLALEYAAKNGGGVAPDGVAVGTAAVPNDLITVRGRDHAGAFFSRLFGVAGVGVEAQAAARAMSVAAARWAAPIAVSDDHPLLRCSPIPCFDQSTELTLANLSEPGSTDAAGAFGLVDLDGGASGTASASELADWVAGGFEGLLSTGSYGSAPGASFNSSQFRAALGERTGETLLLPVYSSVTGTGANAVFQVVGWVGFVPESFSGSGSRGTLRGRFTRTTWEGDPGSAADFGVRTIALVG